MLRKRRRPILFVSDSSDDDSQSRKFQQTSPFNALNISHQSRGGTQGETDEDGDTDILHAPRKKCKRRRLYSSEEIDSTDDEEIVHPVRHGSIRALSDYESGTSSDYSSSASGVNGVDGLQVGISIHVGEDMQSSQQNRITTNSGVFVGEYSEENGNISESSSSSSLIYSSQCRRKNSSNVVYSSDSSESDLPIAAMSLQRKRNRIHSSDDENDSTDTPDFSRNGTEDVSPDYRGGGRTQYQTVRQQIDVSDRQSDRNNINTSLRSIRIGIRGNGRSSDINIESNSDSGIVINNNSSRDRNRFRITVSAFNEESSSTDTEDNFPIRNRVRRRAVIPLNASDDDEISTTEHINESNAATENHEKSIVTSSCQGNSSDSDSESERCAICLGRFTQQEVGVPSTCEHCFCLVCIQEWAKNNNTCPVDRMKFNMLTVHDNVNGNIIRRIQVENPTVRNSEESAELWENVAAEIMFTVQQINADENSYNTSGEEEEDDYDYEICGVCQQGSNNTYSDMIECDECNHAFHLACVYLNSIPVSTWYCRRCARI